METVDTEQATEVLIMEAVGDALKMVIGQFESRLSKLEADVDQRLAAMRDELNERCGQLEKLIDAQAPREVIAGVVKAIRSIPAPAFTINPEVSVKSHVGGLAEALKSLPPPQINMPELKFLLEMPPRETEKTIEYDIRDRPVNIKEKQITVKED